MPLTNCEFNIILDWRGNCVIFSTSGEAKLRIKETICHNCTFFNSS